MKKRKQRKISTFDKELMHSFDQIKDHLWNRYKTDHMSVIADEAGVSVSTISNWMNEKTKTPRLDTFVKVANAIGYTVELKINSTRSRLWIVK